MDPNWASCWHLHSHIVFTRLTTEGASITTLQTIFLSQKTIKVRTDDYWTAVRLDKATAQVFDIADKLDNPSPAGLSTVLTRNVLKSTSNTTPQPRIWQEGIGCSSANKTQTEQCILGTPTLGNLSDLSYPYLAQLPVGYHTGLLRQFIPRINSTIKYEAVFPEDMPLDCNSMPHAFYAHYANSTWAPKSSWSTEIFPRNWSIEACMPGNQSASPWERTYSRQSFTETLYLNISVMGYDGTGNWDLKYPDERYTGGIFRITSNTTAGYFELPNYMNGGQAGHIIDGEPDDSLHCGFDCKDQLRSRRMVVPRAASPVSNFQSNGSFSLALVENAGVSKPY